MESTKAEIIVYQFGDQSTNLEVRVEQETVWLNQSQMVELFSSSKQNISQHISNIYKEGELNYDSTVKEYLTVQQEGAPIEVHEFSKSHDRFLILDQSTVYHIGASLKDLGKRWFAFSKMELDPTELIYKLNS